MGSPVSVSLPSGSPCGEDRGAVWTRLPLLTQPPLQEGVGEMLLTEGGRWLVLFGCLWLGPDRVSKVFPSQ